MEVNTHIMRNVKQAMEKAVDAIEELEDRISELDDYVDRLEEVVEEETARVNAADNEAERKHEERL